MITELEKYNQSLVSDYPAWVTIRNPWDAY